MNHNMKRCILCTQAKFSHAAAGSQYYEFIYCIILKYTLLFAWPWIDADIIYYYFEFCRMACI